VEAEPYTRVSRRQSMRLMECGVVALRLDHLIRTLEWVWTPEGWQGSLRQLWDAYVAVTDTSPRRDQLARELQNLRGAGVIRYEKRRNGLTIWLLEPENGDRERGRPAGPAPEDVKKTLRASAAASSGYSGSSGEWPLATSTCGRSGRPPADAPDDHRTSETSTNPAEVDAQSGHRETDAERRARWREEELRRTEEMVRESNEKLERVRAERAAAKAAKEAE